MFRRLVLKKVELRVWWLDYMIVRDGNERERLDLEFGVIFWMGEGGVWFGL